MPRPPSATRSRGCSRARRRPRSTAIIAAADAGESEEFAAELALSRQLNAAYPGRSRRRRGAAHEPRRAAARRSGVRAGGRAARLRRGARRRAHGGERQRPARRPHARSTSTSPSCSSVLDTTPGPPPVLTPDAARRRARALRRRRHRRISPSCTTARSTATTEIALDGVAIALVTTGRGRRRRGASRRARDGSSPAARCS